MYYDGQVKKLLRILQQENNNTIEQGQLKKTDLFLNPENFKKNIIVIPLFVGYDFQHGLFDPVANDGQGGYISPLVQIVAGGPNQIGLI